MTLTIMSILYIQRCSKEVSLMADEPAPSENRDLKSAQKRASKSRVLSATRATKLSAREVSGKKPASSPDVKGDPRVAFDRAQG